MRSHCPIGCASAVAESAVVAAAAEQVMAAGRLEKEEGDVEEKAARERAQRYAAAEAYLAKERSEREWEKTKYANAALRKATLTAEEAVTMEREAKARAELAEKHAECPICFEPLPSAPVVVLVGGGRRVCRHFFHTSCATAIQGVVGAMCCPCCQEDYNGILQVPSFETDPRGWFDAVDADGNGGLDQKDVAAVLRTALEVDRVALVQTLPLLWSHWDHNGDGVLEYDAMMGPHGLFAYVRNTLPAISRAPREVPDIRVDKHAFFRFWDEDGFGILDKEEVIRSFVKTFQWSQDILRIQALREILGVLWMEFDPDNSGTIDAEEFVQDNTGLAAVVIANLGL